MKTKWPNANIKTLYWIMLSVWWDWKGVVFLSCFQRTKRLIRMFTEFFRKEISTNQRSRPPKGPFTQNRFYMSIIIPLTSSRSSSVPRRLLHAYPQLVNRKGVIFDHENATPHTYLATHQKVLRLVWEMMLHPPYSPDLAPPDYYLFRSSNKDQKFYL